MRLIPLKEIEVIAEPGIPAMADPWLRYKEVIPAVLNQPDTNQMGQPIGFTFDQIEKGLAVKTALRAAVEAGSDSLKLEEPEYAYLVDRLNRMRWPIAYAAILTFRKDITEAEKIDVNTKP